MATRTALIVVDVQNDFCEGGSLAVAGGSALAADITAHLRADRDRYAIVIGSRDDHLPDSSNGGHFALPPAEPDFADTWPAHCIRDTRGAEPHPDLDTSLLDAWVRKGQGVPAYSAFEGADDDQRSLDQVLAFHGIDEVVVVGIATDYCVAATARDARAHGYRTVLVPALTAAVHPDGVGRVCDELTARGVQIRR